MKTKCYLVAMCSSSLQYLEFSWQQAKKRYILQLNTHARYELHHFSFCRIKTEMFEWLVMTYAHAIIHLIMTISMGFETLTKPNKYTEAPAQTTTNLMDKMRHKQIKWFK